MSKRRIKRAAARARRMQPGEESYDRWHARIILPLKRNNLKSPQQQQQQGGGRGTPTGTHKKKPAAPKQEPKIETKE